ncbi:hypothetical protein [Bosea sp. RAC05]|uniref:hypothetical protein n=1 Tax=Bosea sp. RAC05 TaxID=1842539 RepID=UPI00083D14F7|nr:hypothetical protein [Bosea sp. RAC05]AOG02797.1 hypothetical protein BSY19_5385 [Bosea sp. RAC05]
MIRTHESDAIAQRLGLEIMCDLGSGDDGSAYLLEDGRVLKLTGSMTEAAISYAFSLRAKLHPAFPAIHEVHWFKSSVEIQGTQREFVRYAILREEIAEVLEDPSRGEIELWRRASSMFGQGWQNNQFPLIDQAIAMWPGRGLLGLYSGLLWARVHLGFDIGDVRGSNIGRRADGSLVLRDFGRAVLPEAVLACARTLEFPEVPDEPGMLPRMG